MTGAWLVARAELRRRRWALLGLLAIAALVTGVVLAMLAGARRTSTALDRFLTETRARDFSAFTVTFGEGGVVEADDMASRMVDAVSAVEGVERVSGTIGYPTGAHDELDFAVLSSVDGLAFDEIDRPLVIEGRLPEAGSADEVAVNDITADLLDVGVGDVIRAPTFSPDDCAALARDEFLGFNGPRVELDVVGRIRAGEDLQGGQVNTGPTGIASSAFADRYAGEVCGSVVFLSIDTGGDGEPSEREIQRAIDGATEGAQKALVSTVGADFADTTRSTVDLVATVLLVVAAVALVAGLVAMAQAVRRQVEAMSSVAPSLSALGLSRTGRAVALGAPVAIALALGVALGALVAAAASGMFPVSAVRRVEPDPGFAPDVPVLVVGAVVLVLLGSCWAWFSARRADVAEAEAAPARPSRVAEVLSRSGAGPSAVVGMRMAYESGPPRARVPSRSALAGAVFGVLGLVAVTVVVATIRDTVEDPSRYGWTWTSMPDVLEDPEETFAALERDDRVAAAAELATSAVEIDGVRTPGHALAEAFGETAFAVAEGRAPADADEIALGGELFDRLDVAIGDTVTATGPEGVEETFTVVGEAIVPLVDDAVEPDNGVLLRRGALRRIAQDEVTRQMVLTYEDGVDVDALESDLEELGLGFPAYARPEAPSRLVNLDDLDGVFLALALFLAALATVGLAHALTVSARRRRRDFAALRAIGFRRRQVRRAVSWHAVAIVVVGIMIGVPLGVVAGRAGWQLAAGGLHLADSVSVPPGALVAIAAAVLLGALAVSIAPGFLATRQRPADVLQAE